VEIEYLLNLMILDLMMILDRQKQLVEMVIGIVDKRINKEWIN
jgi:hypothetical protein